MEDGSQRAIGREIRIYFAERILFSDPERYPCCIDVLSSRQFGHIIVQQLQSSVKFPRRSVLA